MPAAWDEIGSAQAGMQVSEQRGHLIFGEAAGKAGHHRLAGENRLPDLEVGGRSAAG